MGPFVKDVYGDHGTIRSFHTIVTFIKAGCIGWVGHVERMVAEWSKKGNGKSGGVRKR